MASSVGGLFSVLFGTVGVLVMFINHHYLTAKLISYLYFKVPVSRKGETLRLFNTNFDYNSVTNFDFSFSEIFVKLTKKALQCKSTQYSLQEKLMLKGTQLVERDLNLFNIVQQINKMKATLIVLLKTQGHKLDMIQQQYFNDTMLYIDDEEF